MPDRRSTIERMDARQRGEWMADRGENGWQIEDSC